MIFHYRYEKCALGDKRVYGEAIKMFHCAERCANTETMVPGVGISPPRQTIAAIHTTY